MASALTVLLFFSARKLYQRISLPILNPVLICILVISASLLLTKFDYKVYQQATLPIHYLLEPAVVALAYPLYKQFHQIKPKLINNRRYYSKEDVELIKNIRYLLKIEKITILGTKNILNTHTKKLDGDNNDRLNNVIFKKKLLKIKTKKILNKIIKLKNYGKKNTS